MEATIASGPVIDQIFAEQPELMRNFDLVHFTCSYASRDWLPRFRDNVPCVTSHHHVTDWEIIKHNVAGDAIIVGSPQWKEDLRARDVDVEKVFWVPYGVDAEVFTPPTAAERRKIREKLDLPEDAIAIGFFGKNSSNDDDRKGIDVFTAAALGLGDALPQGAVVIVGPGWQELVDELNSKGVRCVWFPYVRDLADLATLYHALDFYWVTARVEGGPVPLLEAMSSEVCCLTTAVGIAREIVRDGENARLLPFNDANAFIEHTLTLANDAQERKRLGRNARATILEEMHVGVVAPRVAEVYRAAAKNFSIRTGKEFASWKELPVNGAVPPSDEVPLNGFPRELHKRVRMLEALAWSEHLILYHQQRGAATKLIGREWLRNPLSPLPPRVLLRRLLPGSLVKRIVKVKQIATN